jgi:hypothetical protein
MLAASPVVRSRAARMLFFISAIITAGVLFWAQYFLRTDGFTAIFSLLFVDLDVKAACVSLGILVLAVFASGVFSGRKLLPWISDHLRWVAAACAALLCVGTLFVYRNHPLAMDEYAQYLQSQVFAAGKLAGHFPVALMDWLVPPGFQNFFISVSKSTGAVASGYWPSFALLLSPFSLLGIPWACNPVISALTLLVAHKLALKIYGDRDAAALVVLLTVASPEFFINGISYYSMPAHLLANSVYALLLIEPTSNKALLAGLVGSIALTLHNPVPHLLFAVPWILWVARRPGGTRMFFCMMIGYAPLCLLLGVGWFWFTTDLRQAGLSVHGGGGRSFLDSLQSFSVFALPDTTVLLARAVGFAKIWIWAAPGMVVLACAGAWKGWSNPAIRTLAMSALVTLLGYFLVPVDQGHGWGYRYFHTAWIVLPMLAAGALTRSEAKQRSSIFQDQDARAFAICCAVLMLVIGVTYRALQVRDFMNFDLSQLPAYQGTERRVEIINANFFYGADLVQNDPWLRGNVIRMISHGRKEDALMMAQAFPDLHQVYDDPYGAVWSNAQSEPSRGRPNH